MIPVCEPLIEEQEIKNILDCLNTGWISSKGKYVDLFEKEFARYCGVKYGITTTSGTTALHLAISSLGIGKGDEVIIPVFTMIATVYAVLYNEAIPVFVEIESNTWNIDVNKIESKITKKTKAIMPVHIYGHPVDMDPIIKLSKKYNLYIVEDAAEAHGAEYKGKKTGGLGDIGCFSFYANKIITTGEGGMMVTNSKKINDKARSLKDLCHSKKRRFLHIELGYNYRLTNLQSAIGLAQLKKIENLIDRKRRIAHLYNKYLSGIKGIDLPKEEKWAKNIYWMYGILINKEFGLNADEFQKELMKQGIETRPFFIPMHRQPVLLKMGLINRKEKFPVADAISKKGLYLPSSLNLKENNIKHIADVIKSLNK